MFDGATGVAFVKPDRGLFSPMSIYLFFVGLFTGCAVFHLHTFFPHTYAWQEMLINYEGGFVRRGLIGQLLFWLGPSVNTIYSVLYSVLFLAFLHFSYKALTSVFDSIVVAFIFISPVIFIFPMTDVYVYGRKDLFLEIMFFCMAYSCAHCLKEKISLYKTTLLVSIFFITGWLTHEMMIFFFPLFAVLLGVAYARQKKIFLWLCITGVLFSTTLALSVIFSGDAHVREAICASWTNRYPQMKCDGGMSYIGVSLHVSMRMAFGHLTNWVTMGSVVLGAFLSALPLVFLWLAYRPYGAIRELLSASFVLRLAFWPAVCAPFILLVAFFDYGRFVSVLLLSYLFFLYAVSTVRPQPAAPWLHKLKEAISTSSRLRYAACLFALVYMLCWRMLVWQPAGKSYVTPSMLFLPFFPS